MPSPPNLTTDHLAAPQPDPATSSGEHTPTTTYRPRGISFLPRPHSHLDDNDQAGFASVAGSWWADRPNPGPRPWYNPPRRRNTIPPGQTLAYERTKEAVTKAVSSVLGNVRDVAHEALLLTADALRFGPVVGLSEAARVLLSIWDSVEAVETNRMSCLRLTERCATILYSIRKEIDMAGPDVAETLGDAVDKLTQSFRRVEHFIQKQVSRPFLKRYLKRDEDARKIMACDASLTDSVGLFSVAIQIRMLTEVQAQGHALRGEDGGAHIPRSPREILTAIATIRAAQAAHDSALDKADFYAAMRAALRTGSDYEILDLLQIQRGELLEAMKTLQRALEDPRLSIGRSPQPPRLQPIEAPNLLGLSNTSSPATTPSTDESPNDAWVSMQTWSTGKLPLPPPPPPPPVVWDPEQDVAFHREFLESGLEALRRISGTAGVESLPPWTITRWEVDREGRIGVGYFSDVFKGMWRGRQVAIKVLSPTTPRKLFRHETAIWASLRHAHVLELLGASSAVGDPPWFFVSPYMKNGTLVTFLKSVASGDGDLDQTTRTVPGPLQLMYQIAVGMEYLHRKDVLHGDLKANNVLIDDDLRCVISDFGQSELKSEVLRISHQVQPHGTLRWQAPEILKGQTVWTFEADVYAFAIVCIEILTSGNLPWATLDDVVIQQMVLRQDERPQIPPGTAAELAGLIRKCWSREAAARPEFSTVSRGLKHLGGQHRGGAKFSPSPHAPVRELVKEDERHVSPDLAPIEAPPSPSSSPVFGQEYVQGQPAGPRQVEQLPEKYALVPPSQIPLQRVVTPGDGSGHDARRRAHDENVHAHVHVHGKEDEDEGRRPSTSRTSSVTASEIFSSTPESGSGSSDADHADDAEQGVVENVVWDGYESPPPRDERIAARRNERRYRLLLQHNFNPSLNLPLWDPTPVRLGAVGYLAKPSGTFVTLFNAYSPTTTSSDDSSGRSHGLPSIYGYGAVQEASVRQNKPTVTQTFVQIIQGLLTFKKAGNEDGRTFSRSVTRRHSFPLRAGHKHAYLCTENTNYRYMVNTDAAKAWFKANIKEIIRLYGYEKNIQREDIYLVIGTLEARDWGLFVSHEHPDGQVHFNVYADRREGQDWGSFSTDTGLAPALAAAAGPVLDAADVRGAKSVHASKISPVRAAWPPPPAAAAAAAGVGLGPDHDGDAVLLARLRFKPDVDEPTRL